MVVRAVEERWSSEEGHMKQGASDGKPGAPKGKRPASADADVLSTVEKVHIGGIAAPRLRSMKYGRRVHVTDANGNVLRTTDLRDVAKTLLARAEVEFSTDGSKGKRRKCEGCPTLFVPKRNGLRFCSGPCRVRAHARRNYYKNKTQIARRLKRSSLTPHQLRKMRQADKRRRDAALARMTPTELKVFRQKARDRANAYYAAKRRK